MIMWCLWSKGSNMRTLNTLRLIVNVKLIHQLHTIIRFSCICIRLRNILILILCFISVLFICYIVLYIYINVFSLQKQTVCYLVVTINGVVSPLENPFSLLWGLSACFLFILMLWMPSFYLLLVQPQISSNGCVLEITLLLKNPILIRPVPSK